jgi:formate hydrogenlyase subunit 4
MMEYFIIALSYAALLLLGPALASGWIRKIKARLQGRIGPPIWQPLFDLLKLLKKGETLSQSASWMFRFAAAANVAIVFYLAVLTPWFSPKPTFGASDIFMLLYLLAGMRLLTLLAAMDTGSSFGAFAASREATLSFLVEPAAILSLVALAVVARSADLNVVFSTPLEGAAPAAVWILAGSALFLASLVDLSRMPIDDPTTHLELTMVHEAMILEASGKNLALLEYTNSVKLLVLLGISAQCYLHAIPGFSRLSLLSQAGMSCGAIIALLTLIAVFESVSVKLAWRKAPEFIAYSLTLALIASLVALGCTAV